MSPVLRVLGVVAALAAALSVLSAGNALAAACPDRGVYPGDDASRGDIAAWMAHGARARGIPGELPVMGALVESGLRNLSDGDADRAGYFQMRISIWDHGEYAGFPQNPPLQLGWFVDRAIYERDAHGGSPYGSLDTMYGVWVADTLRPAEQYRGLYQLRLEEARSLIGPACDDPGPPPPPGGESPPPPAPGLEAATPVPDVEGPTIVLPIRLLPQPLGRHRLTLEVRCPAESCVLWARGTVTLGASRRKYSISSSRQELALGAKGILRLPLGQALRRAAARALARGSNVRVQVVIHALDASGNASSERRTVRLRR